jgi:hypothetical protein
MSNTIVVSKINKKTREKKYLGLETRPTCLEPLSSFFIGSALVIDLGIVDVMVVRT